MLLKGCQVNTFGTIAGMVAIATPVEILRFSHGSSGIPEAEAERLTPIVPGPIPGPTERPVVCEGTTSWLAASVQPR
jgi:hypothetical protein